MDDLIAGMIAIAMIALLLQQSVFLHKYLGTSLDDGKLKKSHCAESFKEFMIDRSQDRACIPPASDHYAARNPSQAAPALCYTQEQLGLPGNRIYVMLRNGLSRELLCD